MFLTKLTCKYYIKLIIITLCIFATTSCGIYRKTDARKVPVSGMERAKKNIEEGKGFRLFDTERNKRGGVFDFASSNPMWRATIELLDFVPFSNVDYSGGIIITDWYYDSDELSDSLKITVKFLSNEIRSDGLNVSIHNRTCNEINKCKISKLDSKLSEEIKVAILKKAAQLKEQMPKSDTGYKIEN
jgi:hypothetical protein